MAVSTKKTTKARKRTRRSHHALKQVAYNHCPNCNAPHMSHNACGECGYYRSKRG